MKLFPRIVATCGMIIAVAAAVIGCGPAKLEKFEDIGPSETAFVVPLEGGTDSSQGKFDSVEYLEKKKVAIKRISLPQRERSTGRAWFNYEWIPSARVIKVDRAQVAREWTGNEKNDADEYHAFHVESLDSIGFSVGGTAMAHIEEVDSAKHLYHFGGRQLKEVMDTVMRPWFLGQLSQHFSSISLTECIRTKTQIFRDIEADGKKYWLERGITLDAFAMSEGIQYDNDAVQKTLDDKFIAENDLLVQKNLNLAQAEKNMIAVAKAKADADAAAGALKAKAENDLAIAEAERKAQEVRNGILVDKAKADAEAAKLFEAAASGARLRTELEVQKIQAEAMKVAAEKWQGNLPGSILPQGSPLLFGLDRQK